MPNSSVVKRCATSSDADFLKCQSISQYSWLKNLNNQNIEKTDTACVEKCGSCFCQQISGVSHSSEPDLLVYKKTAGTGGTLYYSVRWIPENKIVTGTNNGIEIRDKKLCLLQSASLHQCYYVLPYERQFLVLHKPSNNKMVISLFTFELQNVRQIVEYSTESSHIAQMDAAHNNIIVTDRDNKCLLIWNFNGCLVYKLDLSDMARPAGIHITSDGCALISDCWWGGSVRKVRLSDYTKVWENKGLACPHGVTQADTGHIYACSYDSDSDGIIYQMAADGKPRREFSCPRSYDWLYDVSINKDVLALACGSGGIKLFNLKFCLKRKAVECDSD